MELFVNFGLMKFRFPNKTADNSDTLTYLLVAFILVVILVGALKIIFI
jgi:hypothetical protein